MLSVFGMHWQLKARLTNAHARFTTRWSLGNRFQFLSTQNAFMLSFSTFISFSASGKDSGYNGIETNISDIVGFIMIPDTILMSSNELFKILALLGLERLNRTGVDSDREQRVLFALIVDGNDDAFLQHRLNGIFIMAIIRRTIGFIIDHMIDTTMVIMMTLITLITDAPFSYQLLTVSINNDR